MDTHIGMYMYEFDLCASIYDLFADAAMRIRLVNSKLSDGSSWVVVVNQDLLC